MEIILHRINKIKELKKIPNNFGLEIDVRSYKNNIILNHEPFEKGDKLLDYINEYNHKTLIVNIKEAGIEDEVIKILQKKKIINYFLLDVEFPFIFKSIEKKFKKVSIRVSKLESLYNIKFFEKKLDWIWIDTYKKYFINKNDYKKIKNFKKCIVCPERWGHPNYIAKLKKIIKRNNFKIDAVMTNSKYASKWIK